MLHGFAQGVLVTAFMVFVVAFAVTSCILAIWDITRNGGVITTIVGFILIIIAFGGAIGAMMG